METTATSRTAQTVRDLMESRGVSQVQLSEATAIPRVTLQRRLSGGSPFDINELAAIANHLGTTVAALVSETAA